MSELKAYIGPAPDEKGLADYYLKSEADKVIAELMAENERPRSESCKLTDGCLRLKRCRKEKANIADELRHQKYKRCLAMYRYCSIKALYELDCKGNDVEWKWYSKWMHKWFKLAEKFRPDPTAKK